MYAFRTAALAAILAVMATTPLLAADPAVIQPKPVVLDTPPPPQAATQKSMSGSGDAKPAAKAATKAKKAKKPRKAAVKKPKKNLKKNKRSRR